MTDTDRKILETTVASFVAGMSRQIDSLRRTVVVEGDHPFLKSSAGDTGENSDPATAASSHPWASGSIGHRAGIASCLMQRLRSEVMDPMAALHSRRERALASGGSATEIARNPMRAFRSGAGTAGEDPARRPLPPAPWEVGGHDAERDRAEREQERDEFLGVYFDEKVTVGVASPGDLSASIRPPTDVLRFMDLPEPAPMDLQKVREQRQIMPTAAPIQQPHENILPSSYEEEEHMDQLQRESATLLATYQHSDLEGVQKAERSMVEIATLLSRFTDLITEQQEDIFAIHDQALKSKENMVKGQDQLVDAANRGEKSKHPMATFLVFMALLLLLFNWITP